MAAKTIPLTPIATSISTRAMPRARACLVVVIVETITRNNCAHLSLVRSPRARRPAQSHRHQLVISRITLDHRRRGDGDRSAVNESPRGLGAGGIERGGKFRRDKSAVGHLLSDVRAVRFLLFLHPLV